MDFSQKIGQLFFIGIPGPELDAPTRELLGEIRPAGICLFSRNIREAKQTRELLDGIRRLLPDEPILSIDQEGGLVDRLRRILTPMPAPSKLRSPAEATLLSTIIAEALRALGFNMDFAPVVDVVDERRAEYSNGLQTRNFGAGKEDVVEFADAFLRGLEAGGVLGCIKHFPGLGASSVDSHEELPRVTISGSEFQDVDLYPYRNLLPRFPDLSVMVAHAAYPDLEFQERNSNGDLLPSSLSGSMVNGLLRHQLGFDGLVISDDLEMGAVVKNYGISAACVMAINAGVDMLAICASSEAIRAGFHAVSAAVAAGEISEQRLDESIARVKRIRGLLKPPKDFDEAELTDLSVRLSGLNNDLT